MIWYDDLIRYEYDINIPQLQRISVNVASDMIWVDIGVWNFHMLWTEEVLSKILQPQHLNPVVRELLLDVVEHVLQRCLSDAKVVVYGAELWAIIKIVGVRCSHANFW